MTRPLFARLLGRFLLLLFGVILVIGVSLSAGARISTERWSTRIGDRLRTQVEAELSSLIRQNPNPGPVDVQRALRTLLISGVQLRVYDRGGSLVVAFQRGAAVVPTGMASSRMRDPREGMPPVRRLQPPADIPPALGPQRLAMLTPVPGPSGAPVLYFAAQSEGFLMDETNRVLFRSVGRALLIGLGAATILATLGAYGLSRRLSRSTSAISAALSEVAAGSRNVTVTRGAVTELNQIADDTEHLQEVLIREEQLRARWAQDVAHDLRTPVAALRAQLEGVRDGVLPDGSERVEKMLIQLEQVEHLVGSLNELTRLESPDTQIEVQNVPVAELSDYIMSVVRPLLDGAAESGKCRVVGGGGTVHADRDLVARSCVNLVDNALRYRDPGSVIDITVGSSGGMFAFAVSNQGRLGDKPDQLFERLARGEQSRGKPGSGLGLTIVRAIAERHGGGASLREGADRTVEARLQLPLH